MSHFLKQAEEIFTAAGQGGPEDCQLSILVGAAGGIHMFAGCDWELEPLRLHHGATTAYRIERNGKQVQLEARSATESCRLHSGEAPHPPHIMMLDFARYSIQ